MKICVKQLKKTGPVLRQAQSCDRPSPVATKQINRSTNQQINSSTIQQFNNKKGQAKSCPYSSSPLCLRTGQVLSLQKPLPNSSTTQQFNNSTIKKDRPSPVLTKASS